MNAERPGPGKAKGAGIDCQLVADDLFHRPKSSRNQGDTDTGRTKVKRLTSNPWVDIRTAPKKRVKGVPVPILLRGRYPSGDDTLPCVAWWDDFHERWGGWHFRAVEPSFWTPIVPLPPLTKGGVS